MFRKTLHSTFVFATLTALTCLCVVISGWGSGAIAHNTGQSYLYFQIAEDTVTARAEIPVLDLNEVADLGLPTDKKIHGEDIKPSLDRIQDYVSKHLSIGCEPQTCEAVFQDYDFLNTTFSQFLQLNYVVEGFEQLPDALQVQYDVILPEKPQHTNLLLIEENWKTGTFGNESNALLVFNQPGQVQTLDISSGSLFQGFVGVVKLGIEHIVEGIDHVLFLVALLLPSVLRRQDDRWHPVGKFSTAFIYIIKIATAFTVAHSLTLGLATLGIVQVPSRLVESIIAASIGLVAVDIFIPIFKGRSWLIIFLFGLFHGFGFADVLAELGVTSQHALLSLFGFNLGVEIGQLAIIAVVFPLLYLVRKQFFYSRFVLQTGGLALGAMSLYWFVERAFDVNLQVLPVIQGLL
ncbi:MAG: HupE/UreJ family protein [Cyanobacteria bacterium J06648_16]